MHKLCKGFAIGFVLAALIASSPLASARAVTVSISPASAFVAAGTDKIFTAQVSGSMNTAVHGLSTAFPAAT